MTLEQASILQLLIEFLKDGNAAIIPELAPLEPIHIDSIILTLRKKTGVDRGREFESWYRWFMEDDKTVSQHDRETLGMIKRLVEQQKTYVERIAKNRGMKPGTE